MPQDRQFMPQGSTAARLLAWAGLGALAALLLWRLAAPPAAAAVEDEAHEIEIGRQLVEQYQCGACHAIDDVEDAVGVRAPTLSQFGRRSYIAGQVPAARPLLVRWIVEPASLVPGTPMPSMGVTVADAGRIASFLQAQR